MQMKWNPYGIWVPYGIFVPKNRVKDEEKYETSF